MRPVFADTSYWIALLSEGDLWHDAAVEWSQTLLGSQFVTEYVLVELGSALARGKDRQLFAPYVNHLLADPDTKFIPASIALFRSGLTLFESRPDKDWSLVDCISFVA